MKFLADVNIPQSLITALTKLGHEVSDMKKKGLMATDIEIIEYAQQEGRIILTRDKDFLSLTQFPKFQVPIIVVRLKNQHPAVMRKYVTELLQHQRKKVLSSSLTIVREESAESYPYAK